MYLHMRPLISISVYVKKGAYHRNLKKRNEKRHQITRNVPHSFQFKEQNAPVKKKKIKVNATQVPGRPA